jgi:hypothetical protein
VLSFITPPSSRKMTGRAGLARVPLPRLTVSSTRGHYIQLRGAHAAPLTVPSG